MAALDVTRARSFFAPLKSGVTYFENAGRSFMASPVVTRLNQFVENHPVQPDWPHRLALGAREGVEAGVAAAAWLANVDEDEVVLSHSTTINVYVLANALRPTMSEGDAIVVTNQDHEANSGAWRRLEQTGIEIREWRVSDTGDLDPKDLEALLDARVKLVCCPHVSNVVGSINDVAKVATMAHGVGARVCVDGVAFAPHRKVTPREWDVDFYLFSLYKVYGPHVGLMYAKREHHDALANQSHFFHTGIGKLNPGGRQYEAVASVAGIREFIEGMGPTFFEQVADHEQALCEPLLRFLSDHPRVRVVGRTTSAKSERVPTISFLPSKLAPTALLEKISPEFAIGASHFYAPRCLEGMGMDPEHGVVRVSMVHYNTHEEVGRMIEALDALL